MGKFVHSFSAKKKFLQCNHLFFRDRINREFPFVQGPEAAEGDRKHKLLANAIRLKTVIRGDDAWMMDLVKGLRALGGNLHAEIRLAMTKSGEECEYFSDDAYYRGILDVLQIDEDGETARVIDWKDGKDGFPDVDQLVENAILVFICRPEVQFVKASLRFLSTGKVEQLEFSREYLPDYLDALLGELHEIDEAIRLHDDHKTKGPLCPWCPVGAQCEFWTPPKPKK